MLLSLMGLDPLSAQINYTSTSYCPSQTTFTVTEQTTAYNLETSNSTTLGACGVNWNMFDQNHYAAMEPGSWENGAPCGACAVLSYNSHATTVMIVDECGTCTNGTNHLDLAATAYEELVGGGNCANYSCGQPGCVNTSGCPTAPQSGQVTWHFIQCPLTGSANIEVNNAAGNISYAFKDGSGPNSGFYPVVFWDTLFPIEAVKVSVNSGGSWTTIARDTGDNIPNFWGHNSGEPNSPGGNTLEYAVEDDRGAWVTIGPIGVSPVLSTGNASFVQYGASNMQFSSCVPGSPTATFTQTHSPTPTATVGGCLYTYYDGETTTTDLTVGDTWTSNATIAENATAKNTGNYGMDIVYNWPVSAYYAGVGWNWTKYANNTRVVNLGNYQDVQFDIDVASGAPITLAFFLDDYSGGGAAQTFVSGSTTVLANGSTQSAPYPMTISSSGWQTIDIPLSAFAVGVTVSAPNGNTYTTGTGYSITDISEFDMSVYATSAAGAATVYMDNFGFRGTCPTFTPTVTPTPTGPTATPTATYQCFNFDDFENGATASNDSGANDNLAGNVVEYSWSSGTTTGVTVVSPGAVGNYALQAAGNPVTGGFGTEGTVAASYENMSWLGGLTFYVKASVATTLRVNVDSAPITDSNYYGDNFGATTSWTQVNVPLSALTQGFSSPTSVISLSQALTAVTGLSWQTAVTGTGPITFWVDNICIMSNNPPPTPTSTFTVTNTPTLTPSKTPTSSPSPSPTFTPTLTATNTLVNTATPTNSPTNTVANAATNTPTTTPTLTATKTPSSTPTNSSTNTPTFTITNTYTVTPTSTLTNSPTITLTPTGTWDTSTPTNSPTVTPSFTVTNTPTATTTSTFTLTETLTPSNTPSSTPTNTLANTATFTNTPTQTATLTITPTLSPTPSPTVVTVSASAGSGSPGSSNQIQGAAGVTVAQVQLANPSTGGVTMTSLTLSLTSGPVGQITSVTLFKNGVAIATTSFAGATAVLNFTDPISGGGTSTYQAVINFSSSASVNTYAFGFTTASGSNGQPLLFTGFTVGGATVTVVAATPTITSTPAPTLTFTPTFTATTAAVPVVGPPYPDPVTGPYPITLNVQVPAPSTVTLDIFTTAFRKVATQSVQVAGTGAVSWDMLDKWGTPVADGLYYLRVQVTGPQHLTKIFKVLITR